MAKQIANEVREENRNAGKIKFFKQMRQTISDCAEVKHLICVLAYVYIVTFSVFPGVTNLAQLTFLETDGPWFQIFWVTLMNIFDTVGRYFGG